MKRFFRRLLSSKRRWLLMLGAMLLSIVLYLILSMLLVNSEKLSLEKLRRSFRDEPICHEACAADREEFRSALINGLKDHPDSGIARRVKDYFLDDNNGVDFRISLISIIKEAFGSRNPPDYIKDFMEKGNNPLIRAEILADFDAAAFSAADNPLDYYYEILSGDEDPDVKLAAIRAISALSDKEEFFNEDQLKIIGKLIFDSGSDKRLRQSLILLLSDYYPHFSERVKNILSVFYLTDISGDSISRAFAADILNRLGGEDLEIPEISSEEWDEYYNQY